MTQFQLALGAVLFMTSSNMFIASFLVFFGNPDKNKSQKTMMDNLLHMSMMGVGAVVGLLGGMVVSG